MAVKILVAAGANVNHVKKSGASALIEGGSNVNYAVLAAPGVSLESVGATALMGACFMGMNLAVKALFDANADVFLITARGESALGVAVDYKHPEIIDMLKARIAQRDTKLEGSSK